MIMLKMAPSPSLSAGKHQALSSHVPVEAAFFHLKINNENQSQNKKLEGHP